jgi:hypothetical protein
MQVKTMKMEMALRRRHVLFFRRKYLSMIRDGSRTRSEERSGILYCEENMNFLSS